MSNNLLKGLVIQDMPYLAHLVSVAAYWFPDDASKPRVLEEEERGVVTRIEAVQDEKRRVSQVDSLKTTRRLQGVLYTTQILIFPRSLVSVSTNHMRFISMYYS